MNVIGWIIWTVCLSPIWGSLAWHIWNYSLKPRTIPKDRIDKMVASLIATHGDDADEMAFIEEDAAWRRGEVFQQGLWRQVRRRVEKIKNSSPTPTVSDPRTPEDANDHISGALLTA